MMSLWRGAAQLRGPPIAACLTGNQRPEPSETAVPGVVAPWNPVPTLIEKTSVTKLVPQGTANGSTAVATGAARAVVPS